MRTAHNIVQNDVQNSTVDSQPCDTQYSLGVVASTALLTGLGTTALIVAHHLGRKQYNKRAQITDYADGVKTVWQASLAKFRQLQNPQQQQDQYRSSQHQQSGETATPFDYRKAFRKSHTQFNSQTNRALENGQHRFSPCWISGVADVSAQDFAVVAIDAKRHILWQTPMPERVHDILIQPVDSVSSSANSSQQNQHHKRQVTVMGRRPSEFFWVLNAATGKIEHIIKAESDRHYYGHACYSLDGTHLYVTENNTQTFEGIIGVYEVMSGYRKVEEYLSHGIGPHELVMHPDGHTLVIANGGIKTEKASRDELNLDSMQSSLVYLNRNTGQLIDQIYPKHNQMSVRHLSMHSNGQVVIGIQFQGERHLSVPLVLTHQRGESTFMPLHVPAGDTKGWHRFHHYIASVVVDSVTNIVCVTSPIGGCAAVFDLSTGKMIGAVELADCAGVALWYDDAKSDLGCKAEVTRFLVSDGQGFLTKLTVTQNEADYTLATNKVYNPLAFDNHLKRL